MHIWWIPENCKDFIIDSVNVGSSLSFIIPKMRNHSTFAKNKLIKRALGVCEVCGKEVDGLDLDIHHVRPLWTYAVEYICDGLVNGNKRSVLDFPSIQVLNGNSIRNLLAVCRKCHGGIESNAESHWKEYFQDKYRPSLYFDTKEAKRYFKSLKNGWSNV